MILLRKERISFGFSGKITTSSWVNVQFLEHENELAVHSANLQTCEMKSKATEQELKTLITESLSGLGKGIKL